MGEAIGQVLSLGVGVALSPIPRLRRAAERQRHPHTEDGTPDTVRGMSLTLLFNLFAMRIK